MNPECYSEESDDEEDEEMCVEYIDQLTPGSLHVSNQINWAVTGVVASVLLMAGGWDDIETVTQKQEIKSDALLHAALFSSLELANK